MQDVEKGKVSKENTALGWALYNQAATNDKTVKKGGFIATFFMVGVVGLEPTASWSQTMHATKLRQTPFFCIIVDFLLKVKAFSFFYAQSDYIKHILYTR